MLHRLSPRLRAVADRVLPGLNAADIGSDHGALVCALVRSEVVPRAVAVDVAAGPIARTRSAVASAGLVQSVDVRRGDGLAAIETGEVGTVVIAGMGGVTMARIIREGADKLAGVRRLVLSPHTAPDLVRRCMVDAGWTDVDGCLVQHRGHIYPVTAWERGHAIWTEADYCWGRHIRARPDPLLRVALEQERARLGVAAAAARGGRAPGDAVLSTLALELTKLDVELERLR